MKKIIIPVVIVLVAFYMGFTLYSNKQEMAVKAESSMQTSRFIPVKTEIVQASDFQHKFISNGTFQPAQELSLKSEASGKVTKLYKRKGDVVKLGEPIAKLDDELIRSELKLTEIRIKQAQRDLGRYRNLATTDAITRKQLEDAENALEMAEAELEMVNKRLENTLITAPISGYINAEYIEMGTLLNPGMPIVDIVNPNPLKLVIRVSESEVVYISKGDQVKISTNVIPDVFMNGEVVFISNKGDAALRYIVEVVLKEKNPAIRPGMFAYASFDYTQNASIRIDRKAVVGSLKNPEVFVLDNGLAKLKRVRLAPDGQDKVVVLDGLHQGEKLIVSGLMNLQDGMVVKEM